MSDRADDGFTLVEILVALTIFAISMAALFEIISVNLDRARRVRDETVAVSKLQSLLAEAGTSMPLREGEATGVFDNGFRWRLRVEAYGSNEDRQSWPVNPQNISATVYWSENGRMQSRSLATLRVMSR